MTTGPHLHVTRFPNRIHAAFADCNSLTDANIDLAGEQLYSLVESEAGTHLALDLANVDFLTSTALGKLVSVHRKLKAKGGRFTLENVQPRIREIFAITALDRVIEFGPSKAND